MGARGKGLLTANDRGTGPATLASPAPSANENERPREYQLLASAKFHPAAIELTRVGNSSVDPEPIEDADSPEVEIQMIFRRRIAGLRSLPRRERAQAFRAALEWLWFATAAMREKRLTERHARCMRRQLKRIRPSDFDRR
jgi:hypothetical protein